MVFQVLKVLLKNSYKFLFYISVYISKYHFLQLFGTYSKLSKIRFSSQIFPI